MWNNKAGSSRIGSSDWGTKMRKWLKEVGHLGLALLLTFFAAMAANASEDTNTQYTEAQVWVLMEPACNANGIDPDPCRCIMKSVIGVYGADAAAFVALDMSLRYDEAGAMKERIGESRAMQASSQFDIAQNGACVNAPALSTAPPGEASSLTTDAAAGTTP